MLRNYSVLYLFEMYSTGTNFRFKTKRGIYLFQNDRYVYAYLISKRKEKLKKNGKTFQMYDFTRRLLTLKTCIRTKKVNDAHTIEM